MVIHPSYYDACDVNCDVIYYVIAVRARRMVRIFFLPYLGNRSKSDPCSYELFCLESHILSCPKVMQIPPELLCICIVANVIFYVRTTFYTDSVDMFNISPHKIYTPNVYNK